MLPIVATNGTLRKYFHSTRRFLRRDRRCFQIDRIATDRWVFSRCQVSQFVEYWWIEVGRGRFLFVHRLFVLFENIPERKLHFRDIFILYCMLLKIYVVLRYFQPSNKPSEILVSLRNQYFLHFMLLKLKIMNNNDGSEYLLFVKLYVKTVLT